MLFSNPAAWYWAALAVPIVVFHILRVRTRRVTVSTVMFWEGIAEDRQQRAFWQQLRHLLSLLIQLTFLALLIAALSDPVRNLQTAQRTVVVLDTSASMQAGTKDGQTRMTIALQQLRQLIHSLSSQDELALVLAGNNAAVACGFTTHQRSLLQTVEAIRVTDGPTRLTDAIHLAQRLMDDSSNARLLVITDGSDSASQSMMAAPAGSLLPTGVGARHSLGASTSADIRTAETASGSAVSARQSHSVLWSQVGESHPNVGITLFQVRRSLLTPAGYQILIQASSFCDEVTDGTLELSLDGQLLDVIPLELSPDEVWSRVFEKSSIGGGILTARLTTEDALAVDNTAYTILPERPPIPVTLVTDGNWFLEQVLRASSAVNLTVTSQIPDNMPSHSVLVLHQNMPEELPQGNILAIQPGSSTGLWDLDGTIDPPLVGRLKKGSELLRFVQLENVLLPEAARLIPKVTATTLVESISGDAFYVQFTRPEGDVLVLNVNLDQGDLPLRTAFPIMLTNALSWFAEDRGAIQESLTTGTDNRVHLAPRMQREFSSASYLNLTSPDGTVRQIRTTATTAFPGPLNRSGIWTLSVPAETQAETEPKLSMQLACNLADTSESNLRVPSTVVGRSDIILPGSFARPLRFYLIIAALSLIITEWFLFQRRWIN